MDAWRKSLERASGSFFGLQEFPTTFGCESRRICLQGFQSLTSPMMIHVKECILVARLPRCFNGWHGRDRARRLLHMHGYVELRSLLPGFRRNALPGEKRGIRGRIARYDRLLRLLRRSSRTQPSWRSSFDFKRCHNGFFFRQRISASLRPNP